ncbi:hypothetical protein ACC706_36525, partial [Rhizobium johnstonii]
EPFLHEVGDLCRRACHAISGMLLDKMHPDVGRLMLSEFLEADLSDVALDRPFPMDRLPATPKGSRDLFDEMVDFVRSGRTVGELIRHYAE